MSLLLLFQGAGGTPPPPPPIVTTGGGGDANAGRHDFSHFTARRSPLEMRHLTPAPVATDLVGELTDLEILLILLA